MGRDTRNATKEITNVKPSRRSLLMVCLGVIFAALAVMIPDWLQIAYFQELPTLSRVAAAIVILGAFLWITEAIPAYAVGLLIIGCNVLLLSDVGTTSNAAADYTFFGLGDVYGKGGEIIQNAAPSFMAYLAPWASGLMWLFMAGFVLAQAMSASKLDVLFAKRILNVAGTKPVNVLLGAMLVTFILSMFMSNTATAAMMIALMATFVRQLPDDEPFSKALLLGIPVAANLGGMGTIIGTPPNGIAVENLAKMSGQTVDFASWMLIGFPVALVLFIVGFLVVYMLNRPTITKFEANFDEGPTLPADATEREILAYKKATMQRNITLVVFAITVGLWLTQKLHGISTYAVSLIPIVVLGATSIVNAEAFRKLPWDILMLLAGGLSMGVAVQQTGLDIWFGGLVPEGISPMLTLIFVCLLAVIMSNLMSNTVTAAILIPIVIPMVSSIEGMNVVSFVAPVALTCSVAMLLPISTPPNAVAFASGKLKSVDFLRIGLVMAVLGPIIAITWGSIATKILGF